MIDRVIQKPFLLWQAEAMVNAPPGVAYAPLPEAANDVSEAEIAVAKEAVAVAVRQAKAQPLTPPPPEADDRRGEAPPPIEHRSYFPRDRALSLVQSAVERYLMEFAPADLLGAAVAGDAERRGEGVAAVADFRLNIDDAAIPDEDSDDRRVGGAFEITDPRWVSSLVAMGWRKLRGQEDFPDEPAEPRKLDSDARLVVVGDWASGNLRAREVAARMREAIEAAAAAGRQCHVIHLGDTYYAGWAYEYETRFLPHWPVRASEEAIGSWSLAGNHDMQTGGRGYYGTLLQDERFKRWQQGSSRFSLENDYWQLLGLDTAWDDHALKGDQAGWVERKLNEHGGRTMLLSHHQPFSAYGGDGQKLREALRGPLASGRINAWLWGHEHRCAVYEPTPELEFPRCIGHGGVPVYTPKPKPPGVRWHLDRSFRTGLEAWAFFGFAVLDFDGPEIAVDYVNEFGEVDYHETIR